MNKQVFVYILANRRNGTLYTGVTSNLMRRIYEHKSKAHAKSFTARYAVDNLVWYTVGDDIVSAIELEKKIKNRNRAWKIALIEKNNPEWNDLSLDFLDSATNAQNDEVAANGARNDEVVANGAQNDEVVANGARNDEVVANGARNDEVVANDAQNDEVVANDAQNDEVVANGAQNDEVVANDAQKMTRWRQTVRRMTR